MELPSSRSLTLSLIIDQLGEIFHSVKPFSFNSYISSYKTKER
jgi:hypothetical protein